MTLMIKKVVVGLTIGYLLSNMALQSFAQTALDQLKEMAGGKEHTGVKFDGSPNDQRRSGIDTTVQVKTSSDTYSVDKSTSSYEVNKSSDTQNKK
jgi:hypothetical protein